MTEPVDEVTINLRPLLEKTFLCPDNRVTVKIKLTDKGLGLEKTNYTSSKTTTVPLCDVIGCKLYRIEKSPGICCDWKTFIKIEGGGSGSSDNGAYLWITAYTLRVSRLKSNLKRDKVNITLKFQTFDEYEKNLKEAKKWKHLIGYLKNNASGVLMKIEDIEREEVKERKVLVVVNPRAGTGQGRALFHGRVAPLLQEADLDYHLHFTRYADDAKTLLRSLDLSLYNGGVILMGGDGVIFETINGILSREDWEVALRHVPLGIIPSGSSNGLARAIAHQINEPYDSDPILISTLNIIRGETTTMDLARVQTTSKVLYSCLSVGWGLISDIDIESECLRSLGGLRFPILTIARVIGLRTYTIKLSYLQVGDDVAPTVPHDTEVAPETSTWHRDGTWYDSNGHVQNEYIELDAFHELEAVDIEENTNEGGNQKDRQWVDVSIDSQSESSSATSPTSELPVPAPPSALPDLSQPVPRNWIVCHGEFVMVHAMIKSHLTEDIPLAPASKLDDKTIWLCIIRAGISKRELFQYQLGLASGQHLSVPFTEVIPVRAFRLEPLGHEGCMTVDGERIPTGPVQVEMLQHTVNVLARHK